MLTSIQLREEDNTTILSLPVGTPSSSTGMFLKNVDGLGAVKADISVSSFASYDGGLYQSSRAGVRNIVMTVGLDLRYDYENDVSTLRDRLYSAFPPKSSAMLVFISDNFRGGNAATRKIHGIVESVEPVIFSKEPEVQISILCPRPYFESYSSYSIVGGTGVPLDTSLFGTAPAGFLFDMVLPNVAYDLTLETEFDEPLRFEWDMKVGDRVRISTVSGNKFVRLTPAGQTASISALDGIVSGPMNMSLDRRTKSFIVNRLTGIDNPYTIHYTPEYVGL